MSIILSTILSLNEEDKSGGTKDTGFLMHPAVHDATLSDLEQKCVSNARYPVPIVNLNVIVLLSFSLLQHAFRV